MSLFHIKPGCFPRAASALGPEAGESACIPFRSPFSIHHSTVGLVGTGPISLQNQMFWRLIFQGPILKVRVPDMRYLMNSASQGQAPGFGFLPECGSLCQGGGIYCDISSQPFLPTLMWFPFHLYDVKGSLCQVLDSFQRKLFHSITVDLCTWKVSSGSSFVTTLTCDQNLLVNTFLDTVGFT